MFSAISARYDLLNTVLSFARDRHWRTFTTTTLALKGDEVVLDVATGTGRLARELAGGLSKGGRVVGTDFCRNMLRRAKESDSSLDLLLATADNSPFRDNTFDCATIAFALRNVPDIEASLSETARVVRSGGKIVCLEFSRPRNRVLRAAHRLYLTTLLPLIGLLLSGNKEAYSYLGQSIMGFCHPTELKQIMERSGMTEVQFRPLTWGVVTVHTGVVSRIRTPATNDASSQ